MSEPRVTIITPVRATKPEHAVWLDEAIASVSAQTVPVEMIVVDDHSTVDLAAVREQWPSVLWLAAVGEGCAAARNQAAHRARTQLLLPLDSDDRLTTNAVASFLETWDSGGSKAGIVYSDVVMFGQDYSKMYIAPGYSFKALLHATFMTVGCLHRRSDWKKVGGWRVDMEAGLEDWEYWIALGEMGVCGLRAPEALYWYRRHAQGRLARLKQDPARWQRAYQRMRDLHIQSYNGRYPMGCCGGASYPKGQRPKQARSIVPLGDAMTPPVPMGTREQIQYVGPRMGDFGVVGKVSGVRYHVPGKGMLVEDMNGESGVDVRDVPGVLAYAGFRRMDKPAPAPVKIVTAPAPKPKAVVRKPAEPSTVHGSAIVARAVKTGTAAEAEAKPEPASIPPAPESVLDPKPKPKRKHTRKKAAVQPDPQPAGEA